MATSSINRLTLASYLLNLGIKKGDIVSIYSQNRPEWVIADFATLSCAAANATIYPTNSAPEAAFILNDTNSAVCFCEEKFQVDNVLAQRENLPALQKIIIFADIDYADDMVIKFSDAIKEGANHLQLDEIVARKTLIKPSDLMTLIYSSGTTGQPKGVMLSHANIMYISTHFKRIEMLKEDDLLLSLLPLAHSVERTMSYYALMIAGGTIAYSRGTDFFAEDGEILAKSPGVMLGYLNKPEETKEMFTADGWLKTGDIGILDNEGKGVLT